MVINLIGILEDGTPRDTSILPLTTAKTVRIFAGSSVTINLSIVYPNGAPVDLTPEGTVVSLSVKDRPGDATSILLLTGTVQKKSGNGRVSFSISPADLSRVVAKKYVYDTWLTLSAKRDCIIPLSAFYINSFVTPAT